MQISNLKWKVCFTYNLHRLQASLAKQREMLNSCPLTILLTSQQALCDLPFFCSQRAQMDPVKLTSCEAPRTRDSAGSTKTCLSDATPGGLSAQSVFWLDDGGREGLFQNPTVHNPSVCNKRVYTSELTFPSCLSPSEELLWGACWMKGAEAREIDFHSERNYTDIPLDIHCSECNQIYVGIKRDVPSQISFEWSMFSFFQVHLDHLECPCSGHYILRFHTWVQSQMVSRRPQEIQFPVRTQVLKQENECSIRCLWFTMKRRDSDRHTHTCVSLAAFDSSPLLPAPASTAFHRHLISVDPCLPRSHTAASPVKRRDRCEWPGPASAQRW